MAYLRLSHLECRFGGFTAVDDLSLDFKEGEFIALLGPSGCGKTTTLRAIAGFVEPTGGRIELGGRTLFGAGAAVPPEQRQMSMIFQSYAIWPHMDVFENVAFGLRLRDLPKAEVERRTRRILEIVHLDHLAQRLPAELSGGQQQRVALARAIVVEPKVLLLDEPLSNLDANLREEMRFEIRRLHDEFGITSVYVTHDQTEAMVTADRIVVMNKGRIEQADTPKHVYDHPQTRFVAGFIGRANLIDGKFADGGFTAGGIAIPFASPVAGATALSIRPHRIGLSHPKGMAKGVYDIDGMLRSRVFLGETWEYEVDVPGLAMPLRVSRPPDEIFENGAALRLSFVPDAMVSVR
ncbi:MAG: ABC transporter ATP-binding protein [Proteobacteria bacterium]|nr:ABC transporter ATP-binding protein [Pseudomonadota bacterium]